MRRYLLLELALVVGACSSRTTPAPTQPEDATRAAMTSDAAEKRTPMSSEDAVRAWAKDDVVDRWSGPTIGGIDLYFASRSQEGGRVGRGVVYASGNVMTGADGMRLVLATGARDPLALAAYASYLLGDGADPLVDGSGVEAPAAQKALIKPPVVNGDTLEYWVYQGRLGGGPQDGPVLRRVRVDLATLAPTITRAEQVAAGPADAVETAKAKLDRAPFDQKQGAIELGKLCSDPRVPPILAAALATHKVPDTRKEIAKAMAGCKDGASVKALIAALRDAHPPVRTWAATSLAAIGDAAAKAPLQQALAGERDYDAQVAMQRAIAKLGG